MKNNIFLNWEGKEKSQFKYTKSEFKELETINSDGKSWANKLIKGDNQQALINLLDNEELKKNGGIKLIYTDPPYNKNYDFLLNKQIAFSDKFGSIENYLNILYAQLKLIKNCMAENGFIFLHCSINIKFYIKIILDEIFNPINFRNEIILKNNTFNMQPTNKKFAVKTETIFIYSKNPNSTLKTTEKSNSGRTGYWHSLSNRRVKEAVQGKRYKLLGHVLTNGNWLWHEGRALKAIENYNFYMDHYSKKYTIQDYWEQTGRKLDFIKKTDKGSPEYYLPKLDYISLTNNWLDINSYSYLKEYPYPTAKAEILLQRIIEATTKPGDIVADFFCGSGTTPATAEKLKRNWIACDNSVIAIDTTKKRLKELGASFKIVGV